MAHRSRPVIVTIRAGELSGVDGVASAEASTSKRRGTVTSDDAAFTERFSRLRGRLLAVCTGLVGPDEADDVVQDTYLRARRRISELRDPGAFEAWVTRIAVNLCYNRHQRSRILRRLLPALGRRDVATGRDLGLRDLLERLPARERTVLILHYGHGYRFEEIAGLLGLTAVNVRAIASRSRRALARAWRGDLDGEV